MSEFLVPCVRWMLLPVYQVLPFVYCIRRKSVHRKRPASTQLHNEALTGFKRIIIDIDYNLIQIIFINVIFYNLNCYIFVN